MIACQRHLFEIPDDVAYLNCAYMSPLNRNVIAAMERGARMKATPWTLTIPDFFDAVDRVRELAGAIFNAPPKSFAVIPSASYGIQTAAENVSVGEGRSVVLLADQFPSHVYPWRRKTREEGGRVVTVTPTENAEATDALLAAIDERTAVVATANILWTTGQRIDLPRIRARCDEVGAALVLDLTQSAGAMVTDFAAIRPDFAAIAHYKWMMGPYATGVLYAAPHRCDGRPLEEGWITRKGSRNFAGLVNYTDELEPGAIRYDMGERANFALMPGVVAALEQIVDWDVAEIEATLATRNRALSARLEGLGLSVTPEAARGPHFIAARLPDKAPDDLLARLAARNIHLSIRAGSLRVTPHLWNTDADFDRLIDALADIL